MDLLDVRIVFSLFVLIVLTTVGYTISEMMGVSDYMASALSVGIGSTFLAYYAWYPFRRYILR